MANDSRYYGVQPSQQILQENTYRYTATALQTSFPATYSNNYAMDVYYNGHRTIDYTATDFAHVVLNTPAVAGAQVLIVTRPLVPIAVGYVPLAGNVALSGPLQLYGGDTGTTAAAGDSSTKLATTGFVQNSHASLQGDFKNLVLSATGTTAAVAVSYDALVLTDGAGNWLLDTAATGTITTTATGAGGLDTGALAASTWYSIWRIATTSGTKNWLFSLSSNAPTMPSGYALKARIGWFRTDATANKYPLSFIQKGRRTQYVVSSTTNVATLPAIASGSSGAPATPTWTAFSWANFAPTTAASLKLCLFNPTSGTEAIAAPNNAYGAYSSTTNPPPLASGNGSSVATYVGVTADILVESTNVYYASAGSGSGLYCLGWEDNL
jgi:hypothetical protein